MYYGYGYGMGWIDPTYILVIIGVVICLAASANVRSTFARYGKVRSRTGLTGAEAAERILMMAGISDVRVLHISGNLTDHYNPADRTLALSDAVYGQTSVAAVGVAAHEVGHAIQHHKGYAPLSIRTALVPVANFGSSIAWPLIIIGLLLGSSYSYATSTDIGSILVNAGIWCFGLAVLFQIVTLPVEFNASHRALVMLRQGGLLYDDELKKTRKVLAAAALTYVAGALSAILQFLRLILITRRRD